MADDSLAASPAAAPAAKERAEISDDAARQVLLLHCMQLLSMLKPEVRARQPSTKLFQNAPRMNLTCRSPDANCRMDLALRFSRPTTCGMR